MEKTSPPLLSVQPSRGLLDERLTVLVVRNMLPVQHLTLHSLLQSEDGDYWEAFGHYTSDARGDVNVLRDVCLGGTYAGVEPMGLIWSLRPVPGSRTGLRFRKQHVQKPTEITISLYKHHVSEGFKEQAALASVVIERWYLAPGVQRVDVTEGGLTAALFLPPGPGPFPGLLDLWGGGGGLPEYRSSLLASHGYAALTLDYMTPRTIGGTIAHVGNDYFETAFTFLKEHPQVCSDRIAIMGLSFGASVMLGLSVYSTVIKPRCLVSVSGSHIQPVRGTLSEILHDIDKNLKNTRYDEENRIIWRDLLLPIPTDPSKKVDIGQLQCPLLLLVGEDDQNWPSAESAEDMKEMMERAGNSHLLTILSYPGTGHLIEPPYSPHTRSSNFISGAQRKKVVVLWGGETTPHSHAQEDAWNKTLHFLEENLYRSTDTSVASSRL